ncbi:MAG: hypothetical protein H8E44_43110 [Planctomycetes bacterium]|nr:hypothetical protein [Planctomycetota bacterium]MBL7040163.1 hypothetical protein [Pirellulaceae bacterium]
MNRSFLLRWLVIVSMAAAVVVCALVYLGEQPSELEATVLSDLTVRLHVDDSADVSVLKLVHLFDALSHRLDYATVRIHDQNGYHLAHMSRIAQNPNDTGGNWRTNRESWRSYPKKPNAEQVREFDLLDEDYLKSRYVEGWLPRPTNMTHFKTRKLLIRAAGALDEFDPNEGIEATHFASLMVRQRPVYGNTRLSKFTFAPFHRPRWFAAAEGIEAVEGYIDSLEIDLKYGRERDPEATKRDLETLRAVKDRLDTLEDRGLRFYLLARDG